ncbi:MAG: hypothetical protein C0424_08165 [Sphingobacteriaceae bacterium]|nr:hypothetical protein [Sphingobacteriaceae bacterium]
MLVFKHPKQIVTSTPWGENSLFEKTFLQSIFEAVCHLQKSQISLLEVQFSLFHHTLSWPIQGKWRNMQMIA